MGVPNILECFDACVRWVDRVVGGTKILPCFHGRSLLAFFLPVPVYIFIVLGPSGLTKNPDGDIAWRGGFTAVLLLTGALVLQRIYCLQPRRGGMKWLHLVLITALFLATWFITETS